MYTYQQKLQLANFFMSMLNNIPLILAKRHGDVWWKTFNSIGFKNDLEVSLNLESQIIPISLNYIFSQSCPRNGSLFYLERITRLIQIQSFLHYTFIYCLCCNYFQNELQRPLNGNFQEMAPANCLKFGSSPKYLGKQTDLTESKPVVLLPAELAVHHR